ncbi:MAG: TrkA C-terminal domain-containing protein, partial [Proteobacteria bacterium]|nr:TrkA C-terminal domain-containing protein [Pseudomonadota bacterium]
GLEKYHPKQNDLREKTGCTVVAVERGDELLVEFGTDFVIHAGDAVYICGNSKAAQKFDQLFPRERRQS